MVLLLIVYVDRVHLVLQVPEVPRVLVELTVPKALLVEWVLWEVMEKRERAVKPATRDHLESPVEEAPEERQGRRESQDHLELPDLQGPVDLEETMAPKATPDPLASLETLVPLESLELVDWMAWLETREMTETVVSQVHLVLLEKLDLQDHPARGDPLDQPVLREDKERRVLRVRLEPRGLMVKLDLLDPRGPLGSLGLTACVESPALS
ncbi:uncharacterized protein LOC135558086 [Oncorhynchus masou masou]|uniref:uncharacterized protein LOC135558086 n=1 Tax=Oncorhynchus masou masou TaxID=90313 RepID=UPI0031845577